MKYLPFDKYTITTDLSIPEAQQHLLDQLEPARNAAYIMKNKTKPYTGTLSADGFTIQRIIRYRNSFLPVIKGRFSNPFGKTTIEIRMRPNTIVLIFMSFWMGVVGAVCIGILIAAITGNLDRNSPAGSSGSFLPGLIPFGMLLFGYALLMLPYNYETRIAKEFLAKTLIAE